jgi:hypothetical protein
VTAFWWSRETRQWSAPITDAKLDSSSSNLDPATSPDRSLAWFFANVDAASYGDLYLVDPTCPDPILLGSRVHEEKVWIDDDWTRAVFLKNVSGGVGDAVVRDLTQGVSRDLGTSAASYGTIVSPQGKAVGVLHAWNGMVGTLSALNLGDPQGPPRKYDDQVNVVSSQVPYVITDKNVLYTVKDAERGGTYLAATP